VITQVYGYLLCPRTGRVLVQDDRGAFDLPGGKPEVRDADVTATLVREAFEESQVRIGATAYLGYQEVRLPGRVSYAQVRMAGVIEEFAPRAPDPDSARIYLPAVHDLAGDDPEHSRLGFARCPAVACCRAGSTAGVGTAGQLPSPGGVRGLTPAARWRDLRVGGQADTRRVTAADLIDEAVSWGIRRRAASAVVTETLDQVLAAVTATSGDERVLATIREQAERIGRR
jgi:NUDIX domain